MTIVILSETVVCNVTASTTGDKNCFTMNTSLIYSNVTSQAGTNEHTDHRHNNNNYYGKVKALHFKYNNMHVVNTCDNYYDKTKSLHVHSENLHQRKWIIML